MEEKPVCPRFHHYCSRESIPLQTTMVKMKEQKEQKNPDLCFPPLKNPRNLNFHTRLLSTAQVSLLEVDPIINKIMISAMCMIYGVLSVVPLTGCLPGFSATL